MKGYTLITGASKGIGEAFAYEAAKKGYDLILVSLPEDGLKVVAQDIREHYQVEVITYQDNFTKPKAVKQFLSWCSEQNFTINILINNAGMGMQGPFEDLDPETRRIMMRLNMEALVDLTHGILPYIKESRGYLLNVSSMAALMAIPYKAVYSASKHFVLAFSNALHYEMKDSDVKVSCLCPGPTITSDEVRLRVETQGRKARIMTMTAEAVAKEGFAGLLKGKREIIPGWNNKILGFFMKRLPTRLTLHFSGNMFKKYQDE